MGAKAPVSLPPPTTPSITLADLQLIEAPSAAHSAALLASATHNIGVQPTWNWVGCGGLYHPNICDGDTFREQRLGRHSALCWGAKGQMFVADSKHNVIRKVWPNGRQHLLCVMIYIICLLMCSVMRWAFTQTRRPSDHFHSHHRPSCARPARRPVGCRTIPLAHGSGVRCRLSTAVCVRLGQSRHSRGRLQRLLLGCLLFGFAIFKGVGCFIGTLFIFVFSLNRVCEQVR
jgi:hypothetical protein